MRVRVETGPRIHAGFCNLSLAHERLYGSLGVGLSAPKLVVAVEPAPDVTAGSAIAREFARRSVDILGVPGASVDIERSLPRHVGLGSGTQLALAIYTGIARAHERAASVREAAPELGRGGRSGVGVKTFESGGFVLDAGHPTDRFTTAVPEAGSWEVPSPIVHEEIPADWRFLLVVPDGERGHHGEREEEGMRAVVERANPDLADRIAGVVVREVLPAIVGGDVSAFGEGLETVGRLNGHWYAEEQGGIYRPPAGELVEYLRTVPAIEGVGQSSWGPAVYGVTHERHADAAREAGEEALARVDVDGTVHLVNPRNEGATVTAPRNA
ncbi:MAG: beta-ribofuranosylaminobenzene 5'-phosphate synthase family protein [Halodesulfurarchaeum sp.]